MAKIVVLTQEDRVGDMCFDGQLFYVLDDEKRTAEVNRAVLYVREVEIPEEIQIDETVYIVNSIGYGAFFEEGGFFDSSLTSVIIPDTVTIIKSCAFAGCNRLKSVQIPESVKKIGYCAFPDEIDVNLPKHLRNCFSEESLNSGGHSSKMDYDKKIFIDGTCYELYFHNNTAIAVDSDKSRTNIVIPSEIIVNKRHYKVTAIGSFYNNEILTEITIESSIKDLNISHYGFSPNLFGSCTNLKSLIVPHEDSWKWASLCGGYNLESVNSLMDKIHVSSKTGNSKIVIPEGVSYIGRSAYAGYDMSSIVLPDSVVYIDSRAFENPDYYGYEQKVSNLKSIVFSRNLRYIAPFAFSGHNKLKTIELPNTIDYIGREAFRGAEQLDTITMGNLPFMGGSVFHSLKTLIIDNNACGAGNRNVTFRPKDALFYGREEDDGDSNPFSGRDIKVIVKEGHPFYDSRNGYNGIIETATNTIVLGFGNKIPSSIEHIGPQAFELCCSNSISLPDRVKTIGRAALQNYYSIKNLNKVKRIGARAFTCLHMTSLIISEYVEEIDDFAFECSKLKTIYIGRNVKKIGIGVLSGCKYLKSIVVDEANPYYDSRNNCNAIIETSTNTLIAGCKNTIIPNDVTVISEYAFDCIGEMPSEITIPDSVRVIRNDAFHLGDKTHTVNIGNGVIEIGIKAIYGLKLHHIKLGEKVEKISERAFDGCPLKSIFIYSSVKEIGKYAFPNKKLTKICVVPNNKVYDSRNNCNAIIETATNKIIIGCKKSSIQSGITSIGRGAFLGCEMVAKIIKIPESVTTIDAYSFFDCEIGIVILSPHTTTIGDAAFAMSGPRHDDLERLVMAFEKKYFFCPITTPEQIDVSPTAFEPYWEDYFEYYDPRPDTTLFVPIGCAVRYNAIDVWSKFEKIIEIDIKDMYQMAQKCQKQLHKKSL